MPTVYLIAQPTVSRNGSLPKLEPLAEHGDVRVLVPAGDRPAFQPERTLDQIYRRLENFNPNEDFLVWAGGDTLAALLTGVALIDRNVEKFKWLRYERGRDSDGNRTDEGARYVPIEVNLEQLALDITETSEADAEEEEVAE